MPTKGHLVKPVVFPLVMYGCVSWTIKQAECWRIDALGLWCWRKLLGVHWTERRSNQSILKEINPEYSLEGLMLQLKAPIFWLSDVKSWLIRKNPYAGKDWGQEEKRATEDEMVVWHHWLNGHWANSGRWWAGGSLGCWSPWGHKRVDHDLVTEQQPHQEGDTWAIIWQR